MWRYVFFVLAVILGVSGGLYYGIEVSPVELVDTTPDSLRIDYRTDYVLMVAEAYSVDQDPIGAVRRLALLGAQDPVAVVDAAIQFGIEWGYSDEDLVTIRELADDLRTWSPAVDPGGGS